MRTLADFRPLLDALGESRAVLDLTALELYILGDVLVIVARKGDLLKRKGYTYEYIQAVKDMSKVLDGLTFGGNRDIDS